MLMPWTPIAIVLGAVCGALSRYYVTLYWIAQKGNRFPYGTLFANLTGAFTMGLVAFLATQFALPLAVQEFLLVGFLGSYTTFSSYSLDTVNLGRNRRPFAALVYWWGSLCLGLVCVQLGIFLAHQSLKA
jgi:CrcB protein